MLDDLLSTEATTPMNLTQQVNQFEKVLIEQALKAHKGRMSSACEALGIARKTLYDKIAQHGIVADDFRPAAEAKDDAG